MRSQMSTTNKVPVVSDIRVSGTFYRFHKARYFFREPNLFYKNFIDTRGNFLGQARFAPARAHCGFYFAKTEQIATAEALYYAGITDWDAVRNASPGEVLSRLKATGGGSRLSLRHL